MSLNYNQIRFWEKIITAIISFFIVISSFFIFFFSPQNLVYLILFIFLFTIIIIIFEGYLIILRNNKILNLFVYVMPLFILMILYFAVIACLAMAPQNFPFLNQLRQLSETVYFIYFPYALILVAIIIEIPIVIKMESIPYETYFTREKVLNEGISATAKILGIKDNGLRMDGYPIYNIKMEVHSPNHGDYQLTKDLMVPDIDLTLLNIGQIINVKIDPKDKNNVYFDTWSGDINNENYNL